jgi:hypothetical protein
LDEFNKDSLSWKYYKTLEDDFSDLENDTKFALLHAHLYIVPKISELKKIQEKANNLLKNPFKEEDFLLFEERISSLIKKIDKLLYEIINMDKTIVVVDPKPKETDAMYVILQKEYQNYSQADLYRKIDTINKQNEKLKTDKIVL